MRRRITAAVIYVCCGCAHPAFAGDSDNVALTLLGTIEPSCSVAMPSGALELGDVSATGTVNTAIGLSCNSPFILRMASDSGALRNTTPGDVAGFETAIPYAAALSVPFDDGSAAQTDNCASSELAAGGACTAITSGTHTAIGQTATLSLAWSAATGSPRLAGTYQDVIRISVEFAP